MNVREEITECLVTEGIGEDIFTLAAKLYSIQCSRRRRECGDIRPHILLDVQAARRMLLGSRAAAGAVHYGGHGPASRVPARPAAGGGKATHRGTRHDITEHLRVHPRKSRARRRAPCRIETSRIEARLLACLRFRAQLWLFQLWRVSLT
jgi:hypothetical protein